MPWTGLPFFSRTPNLRSSKEARADLSAAEKVQVLRNCLASRNNIGAFNDRNQVHHQVVDHNNRTFDAAYQFFQANPDFTVADLNTVLEKCLTLPKEPDSQEGTDPLWHARKASDNKGQTPLHLAALRGQKGVAGLLLAGKAEVNAKANDGDTPWHYAVFKGHKDIAELLRQRGGHD